ncbi:hypothetical protein O3P69_002395 [Scylla paramamosain]
MPALYKLYGHNVFCTQCVLTTLMYNGQEIVILPHALAGKGANYDDLSSAGYTSSGIQKDSVASGMMSHADLSGSGKGVVSSLQSAGARGQGISGSDMNRSDLSSAGLNHGGVTKGSGGASMMSSVDKSGTGDGVKASLQSVGAKK